MPENNLKCIIGNNLYLEILLTALNREDSKIPRKDFLVAEPDESLRKELRDTYGVHTTGNLMAAVERASILIIALIEPAPARKLMEQLRGRLPKDAPVISLADRVKIGELEQYFPGNPIIRMALNPSIISGAGVGAFAAGGTASEDAAIFAKMILSAVGREIPVASEDELESVRDIIFIETVYTYLAVKALIAAGVKAGLSEQQSKYIVGQVTSGTLKTLFSADENTNRLLEKGSKQIEILNQGKQLGRTYGFQEAMEKIMAMQ